MELVQVAQHADDLQRAANFYEMLLGEKPIATFDPPGLVFFRFGQTRLLLDRVAPTALLYLGVEDVRVRIDELAAQDVTVDTPPHQIFTHEDDSLGPAGHDEWQAFIKDSEGNLVGLVSQHAS
jgi:methylmalonyl-CoA/ethylmalonyl-CoA epimerase